MAREWFAAFGHDGVGTIGNDTTLASADVDGVLCMAIQALEKRTAELKDAASKIAVLEQEVTGLRKLASAVETLKAEVAALRSERLRLPESSHAGLTAKRDHWIPMLNIDPVHGGMHGGSAQRRALHPEHFTTITVISSVCGVFPEKRSTSRRMFSRISLADSARVSRESRRRSTGSVP